MAEGPTLEALLERTAAELTPVDTDRMAAAVGARLREGAATPSSRRWRRPLLVVVAVAAVIALVVAVVPGTRRAVADFLGIGAVRISGAPATGGPYTGLDLGPDVSLDAARAAVDFPVAVPTAPGYEHPDSVHVREVGPLQEVSLVYPPGPDRPASPVAPVGVLLSEMRADPDYAYLKKLFNTDTQLEFVTVGGAQGVWISGPVHELVVVAPDGSEQPAPVRLAANTLLWAMGDVTYRLEGALSREQAIAVGSSLG